MKKQGRKVGCVGSSLNRCTYAYGCLRLGWICSGLVWSLYVRMWYQHAQPWCFSACAWDSVHSHVLLVRICTYVFHFRKRVLRRRKVQQLQQLNKNRGPHFNLYLRTRWSPNSRCQPLPRKGGKLRENSHAHQSRRNTRLE